MYVLTTQAYGVVITALGSTFVGAADWEQELLRNRGMGESFRTRSLLFSAAQQSACQPAWLDTDSLPTPVWWLVPGRFRLAVPGASGRRGGEGALRDVTGRLWDRRDLFHVAPGGRRCWRRAGPVVCASVPLLLLGLEGGGVQPPNGRRWVSV